MTTWAALLTSYYEQLTCPAIPDTYQCMNPYKSAPTMDVVRAFLTRFYNDDQPRNLLFGINPGRFGSGITGISFTDPIRLASLGIDHDFDLRPELSSEFIYEVIEHAGGANAFYQQNFISAVFPLGFLHEGKNINYYEMSGWKAYLEPAIVRELSRHAEWNIRRSRVFCIGQGTNYQELSRLNAQHHWFDTIESLPHPRWVMQYRRKRKLEYIDQYLRAVC